MIPKRITVRQLRYQHRCSIQHVAQHLIDDAGGNGYQKQVGTSLLPFIAVVVR